MRMTHSNNRLLYVWLSKRLIGWEGVLNTCLLILFNGLLSIFSSRQKTIRNSTGLKSNCFRFFGQNFKWLDFVWSHGAYMIKKWPENRVNACFTQAHSVAVQETVCVSACGLPAVGWRFWRTGCGFHSSGRGRWLGRCARVWCQPANIPAAPPTRTQRGTVLSEKQTENIHSFLFLYMLFTNLGSWGETVGYTVKRGEWWIHYNKLYKMRVFCEGVITQSHCSNISRVESAVLDSDHAH